MTSRLRDGYLSDNDQLWTIRIDGEQGSNFASNGEGGMYLSRTKKAAKEFCRELKKQIGLPCRVVQVNVSICEVRRKPAAARH